jgi:hypothetical protein
VVQNATINWQQQALRSWQGRGEFPQKEWDLSSIKQIVGNYDATLEDCEKLLKENPEFRRDRGFRYNIEWNLFVQPKVDHLRKRLESHNSKILILLKPLELNLLSEIYRGLSDIHQDIVERIEAVHRSVLHLQGLIIADVEEAMKEQTKTIVIPLEVPPDIQRRFQAAAEKLHTGIRDPNRFPLAAGTDAFLVHFSESTKNFSAGKFLTERTPPPKEYLNLLKCIWIMQRVIAGDEFKNLPQDSQWPGYINQLNEDLLAECQRFTAPATQRLVVPDIPSRFDADEYNIWVEEDISEYMSPHFATYMEEVLKVRLPSQHEFIVRDMTIYRIDSSKYRIVESIEDANALSRRPPPLEIVVDLKSFQLTPIYATPSSRPKAFEILLRAGSTQYNPTFQELKHIYRLQHLLTGYKVYDRYDQAMVKVSFLVSGKTFEEHGRLQLWLPEPFSSASSNTLPTPSGNTQTSGQERRMSRASLTGAKISMSSSSGHNSPVPAGSLASVVTSFGGINISSNSVPTSPISQTSIATSPTLPVFTSNAELRKRMTVNFSTTTSANVGKRKTPSVATNSSSLSRSTVTSVTTISTGCSSKAHLHSKPDKPLLVIFLKSRDSSAKLSLVAIQIDDRTAVERERCKCRTSNSQCRTSCVERKRSDLVARRWYADDGLSGWNLARLGLDQRSESGGKFENVQRVSLTFEKMEGE